MEWLWMELFRELSTNTNPNQMNFFSFFQRRPNKKNSHHIEIKSKNLVSCLWCKNGSWPGFCWTKTENLLLRTKYLCLINHFGGSKLYTFHYKSFFRRNKVAARFLCSKNPQFGSASWRAHARCIYILQNMRSSQTNKTLDGDKVCFGEISYHIMGAVNCGSQAHFFALIAFLSPLPLFPRNGVKGLYHFFHPQRACNWATAVVNVMLHCDAVSMTSRWLVYFHDCSIFGSYFSCLLSGL